MNDNINRDDISHDNINPDDINCDNINRDDIKRLFLYYKIHNNREWFNN
jgi:hypothetical protein